MFNDLSSPAALLATRRSGKPRDMTAPGPDPVQLRTILSAATRTPDHGKLFPWHFHVVEDRAALLELLERAYLAEKPEAGRLEMQAVRDFATYAPTLVVAVSAPARASHIPIWEQELSAGAACMNLLSGAHAAGYVASWITGWPAYSAVVRDAFGGPDTRIAGFIFIGSPKAPLEERPRPDFDKVVHYWPAR
jgi:nitroreductase